MLKNEQKHIQANSSFTVKYSSRDIHSQSEILDTWNQEYSQLSKGYFAGSIYELENNRFRIFQERMNRSVFQKGFVAKNNFGLGVVLKASGKPLMVGQPVNINDLIIFSGSEGFEFFSPEKFQFAGIEIKDREGKVNTNKISLHTLLAEKIGDKANTLSSSANSIAVFGYNLLCILAYNQKVKKIKKNQNVESLDKQLIGNILDLFYLNALNETYNEVNHTNYWKIVSNIRELVISGSESPFSITELGIILGLTTRTIQTACNLTLGISPINFLRSLRLSKVRKELEISKTVSDAATRWGFWHFGYFSRDYKEMFGELPSETWRKYKLKSSRI